jgi:hypothetical protein
MEREGELPPEKAKKKIGQNIFHILFGGVVNDDV